MAQEPRHSLPTLAEACAYGFRAQTGAPLFCSGGPGGEPRPRTWRGRVTLLPSGHCNLLLDLIVREQEVQQLLSVCVRMSVKLHGLKVAFSYFLL